MNIDVDLIKLDVLFNAILIASDIINFYIPLHVYPNDISPSLLTINYILSESESTLIVNYTSYANILLIYVYIIGVISPNIDHTKPFLSIILKYNW